MTIISKKKKKKKKKNYKSLRFRFYNGKYLRVICCYLLIKKYSPSIWLKQLKLVSTSCSLHDDANYRQIGRISCLIELREIYTRNN